MTDTQAGHGFCFCGTPLVSAPEIGPYCPSADCAILDGPFDGSPIPLHTQKTGQIATLQARIEQLEDSTPWQPRTTAPVETMILLAGAFDNPTDFRIKVGYFSETKNDWVIFGASWKPTHWRHLPKPPRGKH